MLHGKVLYRYERHRLEETVLYAIVTMAVVLASLAESKACDVEEAPEHITKGLTIHYAEHFSDVVSQVF